MHGHIKAPRRPWEILLTLGLALALGCGGSQGPSVEFQVSAERNYERGMESLDEERWEEAAAYFQFIGANFPYSRYAVLAELRLADAQLGAGENRTAIEGYRSFLTLHPTHEKARDGYVAYRMALAYAELLPGDWLLAPPSYERDLEPAVHAHRHLSRFVRQYDDSPYMDDARELLAKVNLHLARHEWYVANFYWDRGEPMGTVIRLRRLLERHAETELDGDALWLLGRAYVEVEMHDRARRTWQRLVDEHPDHDKVTAAQEELASLPAGQEGAAGTDARDG